MTLSKNKYLNKKKYSFRDIETKWYQGRKKTSPYDKDSFYIISMFPYPSGTLHVGHGRNYKIADVLTRYHQYTGKKVFSTLGYDSHGSPAEMAAIKHKIHPREWTNTNIKQMTEELKKLNLQLNWNHSLSTCNPSYYVHQQRLLQLLWKAGLLVRKKSWVNWDPKDKTVLSNEQVKNGKGWRSGALIKRKLLTQWFLQISKYSEKLSRGLDRLNLWPEKVKTIQRQWIGISNGTKINFSCSRGTIEVFTTKPETLFGVTFLALSPESQQSVKLFEKEALDYVNNGTKKCLDYAIHPETGDKIPVFFADYVLPDYGTGAVMGVPSIDERDQIFAKQKENIKEVIIFNEKVLCNSSYLNGLSSMEARKIMIKKYGSCSSTRLRDWCISRQRYWGAPIAMIFCNNCGLIPNPELPVIFPENIDYSDSNALADWREIICLKCHSPAVRETHTMDTFVDSAWYYLRYPVTDDSIFEAKQVDLYIGGIEHAALHLIYARSWILMMNELVNKDLLPQKYYHSAIEPFKELFCQGMVLGHTYQGKNSKKYYAPNTIKFKNGIAYHDEEELIVGPPIKMSKSLNNGYALGDIIDSHGSDCFGLFVISDSPPTKDFLWSRSGLNSCYKFLQRIWSLAQNLNDFQYSESDNQNTIMHIKGLFFDIDSMLQKKMLNVYVANLRKLFTLLNHKQLTQKTLQYYFCFFLKALSCVAPCLADAILYRFGHSIDSIKWYKGIALQGEKKLIIQVNGKTRAIIENSEQISESALAKKTSKNINLKNYKRYIYIANKVINFII